MITEISLRGFKSWRKIEQMRFAKITGLFGTNSSGKTSVLQWLLMLKQTAESADRTQILDLGDERSLVQLGTFRDIAYGHMEKAKMFWELKWTLAETHKIEDPERGPGTVLFKDDKLTYRCDIFEDGAERPIVERIVYEFAEMGFGYVRAGDSYSLWNDGGAFFKRRRGRAWQLPAPLKCYGFPDQIKTYFQNAEFLADFQLELEQLFSRTFYLGPLREYPKRQYVWAGSRPADMGARGERVVEALLASRQSGERIARGQGRRSFFLEEYVAYWLREIGLIHDFSVKPVARGSNIYQVHVRKTPHSAWVLITDVGFGVSQILPVLAICYYVPAGSTVILEQPEIHLHPSVQASLADVFVDAIKVRKIQLVVESHSEHLLRRLQRRIAEAGDQGISNDDVALYFCDFDDDASKLETLVVDDYGNIVNWPEDFFGDQFGEMAAMAEAVAERRQQEAS
jgi:hypothetical protein